MAYQVLARKYRPQRFADVAGQDHVTRTLTNALTQQRIAHGYIFSGHRGIGKTTIARILAQALNCRQPISTPDAPNPTRPDAEPCGECVSCIEIRQGNAVDVIEIDAATNRGIDEIRELRDAARYAPSRDRYKVYILDEAHQITDAAFNALLKTLEEPPAHVIFMMATTEPESIPQTIRSRCQHFSFHAVKFDDILAQLKTIAVQEDVNAEDAALALLAEAGDGSMRDALSIMDQAIASAPLENGRAVLQTDQIRDLMGSVPNAVFERLMEAVSAGQSAALMEDLDKLIGSGNSPAALARQMVRYLRNCLMAKLGGENTQLLEIARDERARAARTAHLFTEEELTRNLQIALRTFDELNYRQEQRFHLELGLLKLIQAQRLLPMEEILSGLASQNATKRSLSSGSSLPPRPATPAPRAVAVPPPPPAAPSLSPFAASNQRAVDASSSVLSGSPFHTAASIPKATRDFVPVPQSTPQAPTRTNSTSNQSAPEPLLAAKSSTSELRHSPAARDLHPFQAESSTAGALALATPSASADAIPLVGEDLTPEATLAPGPELLPSVAAQVTHSETADSPVAPSSAPDAKVDSARSAVSQALEAGGHSTAASMVDEGKWTIEGSSVRIEVGAKATMIRLTFNAAAEKLIRQGLAQAGAPSRFLIVPGSANTGSSSAPNKVRAPLGSIEKEARANPLVVQAQSIFHAEICSVVDLREK